MRKKVMVLAVLVLVSAMLSGCFAGDVTFTQEEPAGFGAGIWHGWIAPVALALGYFDEEIHLYETDNSGWLYDLGFYISIIGGFGTVSLLRKKKR